MDEDQVLNNLKDSVIYQRIIKIKKIYDNLEIKQNKFCDIFNIHCFNGCGECCEHFTPDISEVEAEFIAYGLIKENKDEIVLSILDKCKKVDNYCPLYIKDSNFHCSIYQYRPLVCRLFGATAYKDKKGDPTFKACKFNKIGHDVSTFTFKQNNDDVICMSDFGEELNCIDNDNNQKEIIYEILPKAINKIRYYFSLFENANN